MAISKTLCYCGEKKTWISYVLLYVIRVNHTVFDTLRPFWPLHFTWTGETYHTWLWVGPPGKLRHTTKDVHRWVSWSAAVMDRVLKNTTVIDTLWQFSTPFNISLLRKWFVAFDLVQLILNVWWNKICFKLRDVIPFSLVYILGNIFVLKFFHMYSDIVAYDLCIISFVILTFLFL